MGSVTPQELNKGYLLTLDTNSKYNVHRKELSSLWEWAIKTMKISMSNPLLSLSPLPHSCAEKVLPTQEEVVKIILAAHPGDEQDLILTILHTMGRVGEVIRLRWSDVNFDKRTVTLWTRKRRGGSYEPDILPMSPDLSEVLMRRWKARKQDEWVFWSTVYKTHLKYNHPMMEHVCTRAKVPHYGFHSLRHFMASYHADHLKTSLSAISKLLRHKSKRTTEIYIHSLDESVREAVDKQDIFAKPQAQDASVREKAND